MEKVKYVVDTPDFTGRNVPITEIAKAIGKDAQYIRLGIQKGILKFGCAMKMENSSEYSYYCPDKKYGKKRDILKKKQIYDKEFLMEKLGQERSKGLWVREKQR